MTTFIENVAAYTGLPPLMVWLCLFLCTLAIAIRLTVDAFFTFREWWAERRPSAPIETTPATAAAPMSIHDDWADIAQQVEAENVNAPAITETKPVREAVH